MKVIAYLCQYEGRDALSTEAQLEQIQIYASRHHLELVEIIKDTQHVADLKQNSGLKRALNRCQEDPEVGFMGHPSSGRSGRLKSHQPGSRSPFRRSSLWTWFRCSVCTLMLP